MTRILVINGSYRDRGITDQIITTMTEELESAGAEIQTILLRNYPIEFCCNCRECCQQPGELPGRCIRNDAMGELIKTIEQSDGFILASPTNFGTVTALFKRFLERLMVYGYWPWEMNAPKLRKANAAKKKALLVSSCAAPGFFGRWLYGTRKQLKTTAQMIGATPVGTLFTGLVGKEPDQQLSAKQEAKARSLVKKLL
ncbi:flavodoxin family protein [Desulfogranum mediterraneum]|uniref:flavodoxin family protein n=1 Tax=Desulfogranum mediterraneum TaxID=160661 RepID=UPI0003FBA0BD|nr:flavodoxin family protein [Desulfogranum mediterraneum]